QRLVAEIQRHTVPVVGDPGHNGAEVTRASTIWPAEDQSSRGPLRPAFLLRFHFDSARCNLDRTFLVDDRHVARESEPSGHDEVCDGDAFETQLVDADVVEQHEAIFPAEV